MILEDIQKYKKHFTEESDAEAYKKKLDLNYINSISDLYDSEIKFDECDCFITIDEDKFEEFMLSEDKFVKSLKLSKEKIEAILEDVENFGVLENEKIRKLFEILYEKEILSVNLYEIVTAELSNIFS